MDHKKSAPQFKSTYVDTISICLFTFPFAGDTIKQFFFPLFVPIGIVGNSLSFLVRILLKIQIQT